jgi:hypothetical protein
VYQWSQSGAEYYVDAGTGAFSTSRSLYITTEETTPTVSGVIKDTPYPRDGPEYVLQSAQPERITFYARLGTLHRGQDPRVRHKQHWDWGAMFALLSDHNHRNTTTTTRSDGVRANSSIGLGITFQTTIQHGVDFYYNPAEHSLNRRRLSQVRPYPPPPPSPPPNNCGPIFSLGTSYIHSCSSLSVLAASRCMVRLVAEGEGDTCVFSFVRLSICRCLSVWTCTRGTR